MKKGISETQHTPAITEKQFERLVKDLAKIFGWRYYHTWRSLHSPAGFPDCVLVRPPRLIVAELKSDNGDLTAEQYFWLCDLTESGLDCYLWHPQDFDEIAELLSKEVENA